MIRQHAEFGGSRTLFKPCSGDAMSAQAERNAAAQGNLLPAFSRHPVCHRLEPVGIATYGFARRVPKDAANGYTLLELLIVGVLVSVLMAGVWSLFRNWSGLYERGEQRVQHMQLVRSLCDQFTDDVHAAAQVGPPAWIATRRGRIPCRRDRRLDRPDGQRRRWWAAPTG